MKIYDITCKLCIVLFLRMPQYMFMEEGRNTIAVTNTAAPYTQVYTLVIRNNFLQRNSYSLTFYNGKKKFSTPALFEFDFKYFSDGTFELPTEI